MIAGSQSYLDGCTYLGQYKDQKATGHGTYICANGNKYSGWYFFGYRAFGGGVLVDKEGDGYDDLIWFEKRTKKLLKFIKASVFNAPNDNFRPYEKQNMQRKYLDKKTFGKDKVMSSAGYQLRRFDQDVERKKQMRSFNQFRKRKFDRS